MRGKMGNMIGVMTLALGLAVFGAGCAKKAVKTDESAAPAAAVKEAKPSTTPMPAESLSATPSRPSQGAVLEGRTTAPMLPVYFDFDKSNIRADQKSRIEGNAKFLKDSKNVKIKIEGNCDERGTNEYNLALGERRAMSSKKYLLNLGIDASRLETLSYGEEKPLLAGHDELSWSQNRRDDFVVVN